MLCQLCQKRTANVHFTQIVNNKKVELYLCEQCANEKGQFKFGPVNISDFLSGFIGLGAGEPLIASAPQEKRCEICGMSYEDFKKTGKLGCSNCYRIFGDRLKPILKTIHGNVEHIGKMPGKISEDVKTDREIGNLREMLAKAVQIEEYEKAAEIRDEIKHLEGTK